MKTVVVLSEHGLAEAERKAAGEGVPLSEYIQRLVESDLRDGAVSDDAVVSCEPPSVDPSVIFGMFDSGGSRIADGKQVMISAAIDEQFMSEGL